ncbi:hypothetical protein [Homoserinimonas sp. A520]
MSKLVRAGLEAVVTITATLAVIIGAFSALLGMDSLMALSGIYYAIWAGTILLIHLAFARRRRHYRLSLSVGASVAVMGAHLVMFFTGNIPVEMSLVPVIMHDFGLALVALVVLNVVHLVLFRRRRPTQAAAPATPAAPDFSERVDDIPAPTAATQPPVDAEPTAAGSTAVEEAEADSEPEPQHATTA